MYFGLLLLLIVFGITACNKVDDKQEGESEGPVEEKITYECISQEEAKRLMESENDYIILDVRTQEEYDSGYIPNAICIPNESITTEPPAELLKKDQLILVYCRSGNRSKQAAQKLVEMGYTNVKEFGGINTWDGEIVTPKVIYGDEQFDEYLHLLEGKRVALFSNQTGIVGAVSSGNGSKDLEESSGIPFGKDAAGNDVTYGQHILDALIEREVDVTAIFCPEHGFRGTADAGEVIYDSVDEATGVPIISLHNYNTHAPEKEDMERFDVLVIDLQDVGLRYYTFYITMYYLMDACAAYDKEVIILDRPNPNGFYVDGPILEEEFKSGVGALPIPVVHGMTLGELAQMINGEGWLNAGVNACDLTIIPCKNYTHQTKEPLIINPSANLKDMKSIYLYASTCFFENTVVSVGRGTEEPFNVYGSPYLQGAFEEEYVFTPISMPGAKTPPYLGVTCYGTDLREKTFLIIHCLFMRFLSLCTNNLCVFKQEYHLYHGNCRSLKQNQLAKVT